MWPRFFPRNGQTLTVDHQVTTFTVTVRHQVAVTPETIKRILESKLEVLDVAETNGRVIATSPRGWDRV